MVLAKPNAWKIDLTTPQKTCPYERAFSTIYEYNYTIYGIIIMFL